MHGRHSDRCLFFDPSLSPDLLLLIFSFRSLGNLSNYGDCQEREREEVAPRGPPASAHLGRGWPSSILHLSVAHPYQAMGQWVREEWRGVGASGEAVAVRRYPGESVGDAGSREEKDKDFQGQVGRGFTVYMTKNRHDDAQRGHDLSSPLLFSLVLSSPLLSSPLLSSPLQKL
ncbi:unnamed protein product [Pleuronectes platessa]|uniref:Uncharacterized protein n=1 Tax=Pleuronectes platessa TaxID=8262 RepID=A0A9N7TV44_PLEPL|nr:unnamed protein product [Pleuronectes platessa]